MFFTKTYKVEPKRPITDYAPFINTKTGNFEIKAEMSAMIQATSEKEALECFMRLLDVGSPRVSGVKIKFTEVELEK